MKFWVPILTDNWMCQNRIKPSFHRAAPAIVLISYNQVPISLFIEKIETSQRNLQKQTFACLWLDKLALSWKSHEKEAEGKRSWRFFLLLVGSIHAAPALALALACC